MKKRYMEIVIVLLVLVSIITAILFVVFRNRNNKATMTNTLLYDASDAVELAKKRLSKDKDQAKVITDIKTTEKIVALTFQGLSDKETNKKILELMNRHERKGTFFVPGILAAEDDETIAAMYKNGHKIGSNTLKGSKHLENYSQEELVKDFALANNIIETWTKTTPNILLCNSTDYTSEILQAAFASGNEKVVKSTHFLNYQSFKNYEQVLEYITGIENGAIITIKMNGVLDETEYNPEKVTAKPDHVSGVVNSNSEEYLKEEERLLIIIEWLLKALDETRYKSVFVEDLDQYYDTDFDRSFEKSRIGNQGKPAKVYKRISTDINGIAFTFRGIENENILNEILEFLEENKLNATFFVTADEIINYPDRIQKILDKNQTIGNGGMTGKDLTSMDFDGICLEIYKTHKILKEQFNIDTNLFMPVYGKYNDNVLEGASSLGYDVVTYSKNPVTNEIASLEEIMGYYNNGFRKGDIIYFNLNFHSEIVDVIKQTYSLIGEKTYKVCSVPTLLTYETDTEILLAKDNKGSSNPKNTTGKTTTGKTTTDKTTIDKTTKGNDNNSKDPSDGKMEAITRKHFEKLRKNNKGKKAKEIKTIYTTEQALSYTFYGINNTEVLEDVLEKLSLLNAKATFFVTEKDVKNNPSEIKKIAKLGHEIGICLNMSDGTDFYSICQSIDRIQKEVEKLCRQKPNLVRYAYDVELTDEMLEAISSSGCMVTWQDLTLATSKLGKDATLEDVLEFGFNAGNISARRGYIIYFRMDYYSNPLLIGNLILNIAKERIDTIAYHDNIAGNGSSYSIKSLGSLLSSDKVYSYPVSSKDILASVKDAIFPGHLEALETTQNFEYIRGRYIGNPNVNSQTTLPGFNDDELEQLNQIGRFTEDKVLFLTFDDWGSDKTINQILYVLNKYDIKATFFVRTNYVQYNPNLLRAIAEAGHAIGSHTDGHLPFAITTTVETEDDTSAIYTSPSEAEIKERKEDLTVSYQKLQSIVGDIQVNGIPALTKIFRPPTLAMSREGMEAIFDMGFQFIVSGDFSTHDYEETNADSLAKTLINGINLNDGTIRTLHNGSVLVLHMSDDSIVPTMKEDVTAKALDIAIPQLIEQGYRFARLNDYLSESSIGINSLEQSIENEIKE